MLFIRNPEKGLSLAENILLMLRPKGEYTELEAKVLDIAVSYTHLILVIDYYSPKVDGVKMSCIQFFVCGIASLPFMFLTETPQIGNILDVYKRQVYHNDSILYYVDVYLEINIPRIKNASHH